MAVFAGVVVLVLAIIGAAWTSSFQRQCRIDPIGVDIGPLPEPEGFWTPEFNLENLEKIHVGQGPEDVAGDSRGFAYTGTEDGWIKRISLDGNVENYTYVGGRALGLFMAPGDELYCAVIDKGLLKISKDGVVHLLTNEVDGSKLLFPDGVTVAQDGTVYFTDASTKFGLDDSLLDIVEGRLNGRVLTYDPTTSTTSVLIKDLGFANGVALSKNEDFIVFCETSRARLSRYWLKGDKEGTVDTFIDGLPGFPDNVWRSEQDGNFYIGLPAKRSKLSDWALKGPNRLLRCLMVNPTVLSLLDVSGGGRMIVVSPEGKLVKKYEDPTGKLMNEVIGGKIIGDFLYLSTIKYDFVGRLKL
ncbi:unnamed protein product [Calypogeia fissa]